jgi:regulator of cell morphogenesis and NO signaling
VLSDCEKSAVDPDANVGSLVTERPSRSTVLDALGIDYCCRGQQSLRDACKTGSLDLIDVVSRIERHDGASAEPRRDWADAGVADMIDHIEATHHAFVREALPRLRELAEKVVQAHGARHSELHDVRRIFAVICADLVPHLLKEENVLFPICRELAEATESPSFHCGSVGNPIRVMSSEHDAVGELLRRLRSVTADYAVPRDACNTYRALFAGLAEFEDDLHLHIHKENNILFPMALARESELRQQLATDRSGG